MATGAARRTERLMCLVFILKARGRRGITRAELRDAIADYAACPNNAAYERMLERDKHDLRDAGIVVDVVQRDAWHEDEFAYMLGTDAMLTLPPLDAAELRVLGLAAEAWERGAWEAAAQGALHKLEVFSPEFASDPESRVSLHVDAHLAPLRAAVRDRRIARFSYRRPGDREPSPRAVEPWGLLYRRGGWYCVAYDRDRAAARVFRTSRIVAPVVIDGLATQNVDPLWFQIPIAAEEAAATIPATLLVAPERGWTWRARGVLQGQRNVGDDAYDIISLDLPDHTGLVGALAAAAPAVLVQEPVSLRTQVAAHLREVACG